MARRHGLHIGFGFTERAKRLPYNTYAVASPDGALVGAYRNCGLSDPHSPPTRGAK